MINILYFSNQKELNGGAPRSLYEILKNLDRKKIKPFFASIYDDELAYLIKQLDIKCIQVPRGYFLHPIFEFISIPKIVRFIIENKIKIIHNNQCSDAFYTWIPAKVTNTPFIIHHRDPSFYKSHSFLMKLAVKNIAISTWQNKHNLSNKAEVIHNGVDLNQFKLWTPSKSTIGFANDKLLIGLVGRITNQKGHDIFIRAASIVASARENVEFLIIGNDHDETSIEYINQIKSLVHNLNLYKYVHFIGYYKHISEILPYLDISVVPSRKEPFGRVIIESMASEKPVIATNIWGALDIVTPNTGLLIPPEDPEQLAAAIIDLIDSPEKRARMGIEGRKRVEELFTIEEMLNNIYNLYEKIKLKKI